MHYNFNEWLRNSNSLHEKTSEHVKFMSRQRTWAWLEGEWKKAPSGECRHAVPVVMPSGDMLNPSTECSSHDWTPRSISESSNKICCNNLSYRKISSRCNIAKNMSPISIIFNYLEVALEACYFLSYHSSVRISCFCLHIRTDTCTNKQANIVATLK